MWGCVRYLSTVSVPAQQAQLHTAADSGRTKSLIKKGPPQNNQYMFLEYFFSTYLALSDGLFFGTDRTTLLTVQHAVYRRSSDWSSRQTQARLLKRKKSNDPHR